MVMRVPLFQSTKGKGNAMPMPPTATNNPVYMATLAASNGNRIEDDGASVDETCE